MCWYYIRKDSIDLMLEGHIVDAGGNYQLITDVGLPTMFSIYCTLGKWFDADYIKYMFEKIRSRFWHENDMFRVMISRLENGTANEPHDEM